MSVEPITLRGTELSGKAGTEVEATRPGKRGRRLRIFGRYVALSVLAFIVLFPLYITVVNSLLQPQQIASKPPDVLPDVTAVAHLLRRLERRSPGDVPQEQLHRDRADRRRPGGDLDPRRLRVRVPAFPFKRTLFVVFLATLMVPFEITIVTNLQTIDTLGWYDTYAALAVPFLATGFGAFLLRQAFLQVPKDLQDAAALDGYGHLRFLARVAVPLARPTVAALAVFSFLSAWNQYLWPLLVTKDDRLRTVQIGLKQLRATNIDRSTSRSPAR